MRIFDLLLHNKNSKSRISDLPQDNRGLGGAFTVLSRSFGLTKEKEDIIPEQKNVDNLWSKEISLRFAVCLAELGDIPAATKYAKDILQETDLQSNSQMLHLLSILTSSTGDCEKVRNSLSFLNLILFSFSGVVFCFLKTLFVYSIILFCIFYF
jgi:hypothetical protein